MQKLDIDKRDHALSILERLNALRREEKSCDFVIKVDEEEIKAHRSVLTAGSDYFDAMLCHDTAEKSNGIVEMKDVSFASVQKCVDFIYTGEIEASVEECDALLYVVNTLQLQVVREKISELLESSLMPERFQDIRNIALKYSLEKLGSACDEYALENLDLLTKQDIFFQFDIKYVTFLLSSKSLHLFGYTEETKLVIIINWIKVDPTARQCHLMELTKSVDLGKISNSFGKYLAESEAVCSHSAEFMTKLYLSTMAEKKVTAICPAVQRHIPNAILLFTGSPDALSVYQPGNNSVTEIEGIERVEQNSSFFAIASKNQVYLLMSNQKFYMLEIQRWKWVTKPSMSRNHGSNIRATLYDRNIYVCGAGILEKFSISENEWKTIESDDCCRDECEIVAFDDNIFCVGGNITKKVDAFNPVSKSWSPRPCMNSARRTPAAIDFKGKLYVAGGYDLTKLSTVEVYDSESDLWTNIEPMAVAHDEFMLCVVGNKLYAMSSGLMDTAEVYDNGEKKWEVISALSDKKISAGISVFLPDVFPE